MKPLVLDDLLPEPEAYRSAALLLPFGDLRAGDVVFHGMAPIGPNPLSARLDESLGLITTFSAFRLSPEGQEEPNYIHTDRDMGDWTAILFLNPNPPEGDGTTFYRHRDTGAIASTADGDDLLDEQLDWRDVGCWESWHTVPAAFNRCVVFPAGYFHARALFRNWGQGQDARLIQLAFGTGTLPLGD
jgi:hypothetical protein